MQLVDKEIMAKIANEENGECEERIDEDYLDLNETINLNNNITKDKNQALPFHSFNEFLIAEGE